MQALNLDCAGDHFTSSEFCFFDRKHKSCRGFAILTASVYHPLLRKQMKLQLWKRKMKIKQTVKLFWNLLNECLRKVPCDSNYKLNPVGWCADMAGANLAGFTEVFGETVNVRIKACEFPFKDHRNKNARKLDADIAAEFMTLCDNLLLSATEAAYYESSKAEIEEFYCNKGRAVDFVILGLVVARKTGFHFLRICTSRRAENESSRGHSHWVGVQGPP